MNEFARFMTAISGIVILIPALLVLAWWITRTPPRQQERNIPVEFIDNVTLTLIRYGWRQGGYGNVNEGFCLVGAIHYVRLEKRYTNGQQALVERYLRDECDTDINSWNDAPGRKREDVIALLEKVRVKLENVT